MEPMSTQSSLSPTDALRIVSNAEAKQALLDLFAGAHRVQNNSDDPLLVMLLSRRLACICEMLADNGDIARFDLENFEIVTDRVLDALDENDADNNERWIGRSAVLINDVERPTTGSIVAIWKKAPSSPISARTNSTRLPELSISQSRPTATARFPASRPRTCSS